MRLEIQLTGFEQVLPPAILQAGEKLWLQHQYERSQLDAETWLVTFKQGRRQVQLQMNLAGELVREFSCSCDKAPEPCEHLAALLLHLTLGEAGEQAPAKRSKVKTKAVDPLADMLQQTSREKLEALLFEIGKQDAAMRTLMQLRLGQNTTAKASYYAELQEAVTAKLRTTKTAKPFKNMADEWKQRISILAKQKDPAAAQNMIDICLAVQKLLVNQVDKHHQKLFPFSRVLKAGYAALEKRTDYDLGDFEHEKYDFLLTFLDAYPQRYVIDDDYQQFIEMNLGLDGFARALYSRFSERHGRLNDRTWSRLLSKLIALEPAKTEFFVAKYFQCCYERNWAFAKQLALLPEADVRLKALQTYFQLMESTVKGIDRKLEYRELKERLLG
ncbi:MAG: hypothetical protein C0424_03395 [Sphingobacteriaceae bacterium]|nr:hypothetical protein [Sphingobacteriaceae bacterium]